MNSNPDGGKRDGAKRQVPSDAKDKEALYGVLAVQEEAQCFTKLRPAKEYRRAGSSFLPK